MLADRSQKRKTQIFMWVVIKLIIYDDFNTTLHICLLKNQGKLLSSIYFRNLLNRAGLIQSINQSESIYA